MIWQQSLQSFHLDPSFIAPYHRTIETLCARVAQKIPCLLPGVEMKGWLEDDFVLIDGILYHQVRQKG